MNPLFLSFLSFISGVSIIAGIFLFLRPASAIEFQRRFYEKINWRIEPISMEKEKRNTKIMGLFLIGVSLLTFAYIFIIHFIAKKK